MKRPGVVVVLGPVAGKLRLREAGTILRREHQRLLALRDTDGAYRVLTTQDRRDSGDMVSKRKAVAA